MNYKGMNMANPNQLMSDAISPLGCFICHRFASIESTPTPHTTAGVKLRFCHNIQTSWRLIAPSQQCFTPLAPHPNFSSLVAFSNSSPGMHGANSGELRPAKPAKAVPVAPGMGSLDTLIRRRHLRAPHQLYRGTFWCKRLLNLL